MKTLTGTFLALLLLAASANAATIQFDLQGTAGFGLLGGNENPAVPSGQGGSGGEIGAGISYDDGSNVLTINIAWGSGNGFTDLTGDATAGHIHGPTVDGGSAAFTENAAVKYPISTLPGWVPSASSGHFIGTVTVDQADEAGLEDGQFYINVHTTAFPGGEIRGYLEAVPEGSTLGLLALGFAVLGIVGRRGVNSRREGCP